MGQINCESKLQSTVTWLSEKKKKKKIQFTLLSVET